jgi:hypothetical protein
LGIFPRHFLVFSCLLESYYFTGFVVFWLGCTHPTLSETTAFAVEMAEGTITDFLPPKKR